MSIKLTESQKKSFDLMKGFVKDKSKRIFILKGYAGTGKTTLMKFLIEDLKKSNKKFKLLASTGRAAKILSDLTGSAEGASTIHSMIYSFSDLNQDFSDKDTKKMDEHGQLFLIFEPHAIDVASGSECVYIIDEASMISDSSDINVTQAKFGSGRLLAELLAYDKRSGSKFIFVGDPCQLPPIQETFSPALSESYIHDVFGMDVQEAHLTEIMRQKGENNIVAKSQLIRSLFAKAPDAKTFYGPNGKVWGKLPFSDCCTLHSSLDVMLAQYIDEIKKNGFGQASFICKSNKDCLTISQFVRKQLGFTEPIVQKGDLLMVTQNNLLCGLVNGDMVEVISVGGKAEHRAGQVFRTIKVKELFSKRECTVLFMEGPLSSVRGNLDSFQQTSLFIDFIERMKNEGITQKMKDRFHSSMKSDPYLNALRCSYGYAITCHKAQGGEWPSIYIHIPRNFTLNPTKETYQWIYTAMTRAKKTLNMVKDFYID